MKQNRGLGPQMNTVLSPLPAYYRTDLLSYYHSLQETYPYEFTHPENRNWCIENQTTRLFILSQFTPHLCLQDLEEKRKYMHIFSNLYFNRWNKNTIKFHLKIKYHFFGLLLWTQWPVSCHWWWLQSSYQA